MSGNPWSDCMVWTKTTAGNWPNCWPTSACRLPQRQLDLSVILAHHTPKNAVGGVAVAQGLGGSSDSHAFGDSNLNLRRVHPRLALSSEHRAEPACFS